MRDQADHFINNWIAVQFLAKGGSGETETEVHDRFRREAAKAGLEPAEIDQLLLDPDMPRVVKKLQHAEPSS